MTVLNDYQHFIGIDVSKDYLDIYIRPENIFLKFPNTIKGLQSFITLLSKYDSSMMSNSVNNSFACLWASEQRSPLIKG